ncbi:MAG: MFS transporter [marine bacterium B5-7]|nr:MAG: MFS transporter [marine bacterium B5-7]
MEGLSRSILVGIVPLIAFESLGSKELVSYVYLVGAVFTLLITLNVGSLERALQRWGVVTLGGLFLILAALFLYIQYGPLFALGIGMRSAAASIFSVCMSLYIMDYIGKRDLTRNESRRMIHAGVAWLIGPTLGVWMYNTIAPGIVFLTSALIAVSMLIYFWWLRLGSNQVIRKAHSLTKNPMQAIHRYIRQPRLRIAYGITLSRSCFWVALFVYGPIYVIEAGLPPWVAGALLSGVCGLLLLSPIVQKLADRFGTRLIIISGLLLTGFSTIILGLLQSATPVGIIFWITGSMGGAALDVLGNIPFMRSVKPRERLEMTTVFSTWREGSELLTQIIVVIVLSFAPFWVFYLVLGFMHLASASSASYLPKRL